MSYKSHLEKIQEAKNDNKLVFFIGSGMSKNVGLPDWGELIDELKKDLNTTEEDYLKIAQLYFLEFGEYEYIKKVKSFFPSENIVIKNTHSLLVKLFPQNIITTNWDIVIEKAIENEMALYDVVRNDSELINTTSNRKLIKMHGDIEIGNIIFKEDDYLEYSQKFPLIENYVKSVLSTNTVIFFGYSYNDINLKYITKWIQNSSKVRPPAYMIVFKEDKIQEKYFKNHGVSVLNISDKYTFKDRDLQIEAFLNDILITRNNFVNIQNELEIIDAFYNLFQDFKYFNIVLIDQLSKLLKKKSIKFKIDYDNSERVILHLQNYYSLIDNIFKNFRTLFQKKKRIEIINKIKFIISVLHKSGIIGIAIENSKYHLLKEKIFQNNYKLDNYIFEIAKSCGTNEKDAYVAVWNEDFKQAYTIYKKLILSTKKNKNYIDMFLLMYNSNIILSWLKVLHNHDYKNEETYSISEKLLEVKQSIREHIEPLLSIFKDDSILYKYMYDVKIFHENRQKQVKIIQNGGMSFSSNETEARQKHKNLLYFVNNNYLCMDIYEDFKNLQIEYLKTTLTRQFRSEFKTLEIFELYTCIKYVNTEKIKDILDTYLNKESNDFKKFRLSDDETNYLIDLLNSLTSILENISDMYQVQKFETYWINTLYLISLSNYSDIKTIVENFIKVLKIRSSINIYREINLFLRIQKYIFESDIINNQMLFSLLEIAINKIITSNYNSWDLHLLESNTLLNYLLDEKEENKYSNLELINALLKSLTKFDDKTQVNISKYFLLNIHDVSDEGIQNSIKFFLMDLNFDSIEIVDLLEFKLLLLSRDLITFDDFDFEEKINKFIEPYFDGKSFSSSLYKVNNLLEYLIQNKQILEFTDIQKKIAEIIERYKNLKFW
ncbi:SIR2 family protein [Aliarcobacter cryaerophilus]|uniref:SIR2 family protein n=2 Tax=unclassified Arcobacter TaxID=2593671 RepID=A0AA96CLI9_9BACT|nr:SIR2 family protein [Aliarcobacter cryaerophilus]WNL11863.1 SIR2 family protein [Arcobacter sp. AZ-2023]WPD10475.1 SIR2 family protein [Arcobacter sp. DSM 115954]WNL15307.1 SIR2 family protein [Arcobacter sp. AZ-2023]WNL18813.1 SIR2 family protein [Arcobacter sp. AZ-2023]WNL20948.1 SIR2 family protein [Arcobacter sp. AZ-2023]